MAVIESGASTDLATVEATFKALRVSMRPLEYATLGQYQVSAQSGAIAAALGAGSTIFSCRWTDATRLCVLQKLSLTGMRATTAFAAGVIDITATIARSFLAPDSGQTAISLVTNNNKLRTNMGTSLMGDMRISNTGAITAGTRTLDGNAFGTITSHSSGGTGSATPIIGNLFLPINDLFEQDTADGEHPIVLAQNEGIVVRATVPGTGVWNFGITMKWAEVAAY